jgi:hypothetical protein
MTDPRPLTREELARFLPNQRAIRAFEELFRLIPEELDASATVSEEIAIEAATAGAASNEALALLERIAHSLELLAAAPAIAHDTTTSEVLAWLTPA